jgi:pilus assembly protein Flp/PilA
MQQLKSKIVRFIVSEDGPTSVEYAVMLALIIVGAIGAVLSTGSVQKAMFQDVAQEINDSMNAN